MVCFLSFFLSTRASREREIVYWRRRRLRLLLLLVYFHPQSRSRRKKELHKPRTLACLFKPSDARIFPFWFLSFFFIHTATSSRRSSLNNRTRFVTVVCSLLILEAAGTGGSFLVRTSVGSRVRGRTAEKEKLVRERISDGCTRGVTETYFASSDLFFFLVRECPSFFKKHFGCASRVSRGICIEPTEKLLENVSV